MAYTPILGKNKKTTQSSSAGISKNKYIPILAGKQTKQPASIDQSQNNIPVPDFSISGSTQAIPDITTPSTLDLGASLAQGIARIPAEFGVSVGQAGVAVSDKLLGKSKITQAVKPLKTGNLSWLLGKEPIKGYAPQILDLSSAIKKSKIAKKYGIAKYSLPIGFIGGVALDTLNFLGGEESGAKTFLGLAKKIPDTATGINDMYRLARGAGFSEDIAKQYAPLWAKEQTSKGIGEITDAAVKLQNTTKEVGAYTPILGDATKPVDTTKTIFKTPLQKEAVKYKTAKEFVDAQPTIYHQTNIKIKEFKNKPTFFNTFKRPATYGKNTIKVAYDIKKPFEVDAFTSGDSIEKMIPKLRKQGYDSVIAREDFNNPNKITRIIAFNPKTQIKTQQQLTKIWEGVHKPALPKIETSKLPTQTTTVGKQTQRVIKDVTGKKASIFIRKRETTLLKDRIKGIQQSAKSVADKKSAIQRLRNDFNLRIDKTKRAGELKVLKTGITERIKGIQKGFREGTLSTKQDVKTAQSQLTDMVKNSALEAKDKTKFLSSIKNVQTSEQLKKVLPTIQKRIKTLEDTATHKTLLSQIKSELKSPLTRKAGSIRKSKYSPETTRLLKEYKTDVSFKNPENAATKLKFQKLEITSKWIAEHPNEYMPDSVVNQLNELNKKHLPLLTNEELAQQLKDIQSLKTQGKTYQRISNELANNQRAQVVSEMRDIISGGKTIEIKPIVPESKNIVLRAGKEVKKLHLSMLNSDTLFDTLDEATKGNLNAGKINEYFQNVTNKARDVEIIGNNNDLKLTQELLNKHKIGKEVYDKVAFNIAGKTVKMDRKAMIDVYISSFDKAKLASMIEGNHIPQKTIDEIISKLKPNEKAFGNDALSEVYAKGYVPQNEVYKKVNFMDMPKNDGYSRMFKDMRYVQNEEINIAQNNLAYAKASVSKGMTKARVGSLAPIKLDAIDNLMNYVYEKNHYIAWELPVKEMNSVLKGISGNISEKYGSDYVKILNEWLKRVAGDGRYDSTELGKALLGLRRGLTKSLITNFITPLKQTISLSSFMVEISGKDLSTGMAQYWANKSKWDEFWNKVPQIQNRSETLTRDIGAISKSRTSLKKLKGEKIISEVGVAPVRFFDRLTVRSGATAVYKKALKDGLSEKDALNKVLGVVRRTQITGDIKDISAIQAGGALEKLLTMFQNQPNKYYNIIYQNIRGYATGRVGKVALGRALLYSWVVPAIAYEEFSTGGTAKPEDLIKAVLFGPFIDILVLGNIASAVKSGYNYTASPIEEIPQDLIKGMQQLSKGEILKSVMKMVKIGARVSGFPVNQPIRTYKGIADITSGKTSDWRRLIWSKYALNEKNPPKTKRTNMPIPSGLPSLGSSSLPKLPSLPSLPKI